MAAFQSTLPRRKRRYNENAVGTILYFNPRFREGSDFGKFLLLCGGVYFNPRFREGSDDQMRDGVGDYSISIHASAKEAT